MSMAVDIGLVPGDYHGTYKLIGGHPALDFANLVSYRGTARAHDWLDPVTNVRRWVEAAGLEVARVPTDIDELRDLRELLARVFVAVADGATPDPGDIDRLGTMATRAWSVRRLHFPATAGAAVWRDTKASLSEVLALHAVDLLTSSEALLRVSTCGDCRWLFLDTTRNRSRRWCDPADCGNRVRQRRHYHRNRP